MNPVEIGLSFLEGMALIASPCILPVLPLVLSASVEGGRKRPFGIILGFVLSFTIFALISRQLVAALHIDLDYIKYGSLILLAAFGIILLSEKLSAKFSAWTQRFANAGSNLTANANAGFFSGVLIGFLIGLVWTPCAGPILAAVLVQVIRQENDLSGFLIIAAFAIGAGVPMLVIALTGRKLMSKLGFFTQHAEQVRKAFGVIILLAVAYIASGANPQPVAPSQDADVETGVARGGLQSALAEPYDAPEFTGIETWLNSDPLTMRDLRSKVVLIDFWTYSCINCIRTLPYITFWDQKYRDKGLVIVGVHAPEFEFEKNQKNVEAAIKKYGIHYPVAMDNNLDTWTAFKNRYWPAHYLINQEGKVVYTHFGEGQYAKTESNIRALLGITDDTMELPEQPAFRSGQTPETYLGYARAKSYGGSPALAHDADATYQSPASLPANGWSLNGGWNVAAEKITATEVGAKLKLHFQARRVFLVLGTATGAPVDVSLTLNGKPVIGRMLGDDANAGKITVDSHRLYSLINQPEFKSAVLEISTGGPGLEAYAFTFGD